MNTFRMQFLEAIEPLSAILEHAVAHDDVGKLDNMLAAYDAATTAQAALRAVAAAAEGDERHHALVMRHAALRLATAIATTGTRGDVLGPMIEGIIEGTRVIRDLPA